jgi:hypothetical protein
MGRDEGWEGELALAIERCGMGRKSFFCLFLDLFDFVLLLLVDKWLLPLGRWFWIVLNHGGRKCCACNCMLSGRVRYRAKGRIESIQTH